MNYKTGGSHWIIDSGCTQHMIGDLRMFTSLDEEVDGQERIIFRDNSKGKVKGLGKVAISNDHSFKCAICCFLEFQLAIHWTIM